MDIHLEPLTAPNPVQRIAVLSAREDDPTSTQQTTIIIAATVSVGGLVLVLIAFRLLRRWYKANKLKPTPLPPVQPLAHEREQQLARFEAASAASQPPTWYEASLLSAPGFLGSTPSAGSKASLLGRSDSDIPSRIPSSVPSQLSVEDAAALSGPPMQLDAPQPHFHNVDISPSSTSLGSMDDSDGPYTPDSGTIPSTMSHSSNASRQRSVSASSARPRSQRPGRSLSRPQSMASSASTTYSRKTMHGLPHGPHSQVQIVLPAPLAPLASNGLGNEIGRHSVYSEVEYRKSIVDQWASTAVSGSNSSSRGSRSRSITGEARASNGSLSGNAPIQMSNGPFPRRLSHSNLSSSSSQSRSRLPQSASPGPIQNSRHNSTGSMHNHRSSPSLRTAPAPPVPPIPAMYSNAYNLNETGMAMRQVGPPHMIVEDINEGDVSRGRSRSASVVSSGDPLRQQQPTRQNTQQPKPPPRKLKRSRSRSKSRA